MYISLTSCVKVKVDVPDSSYVLCERKATLEHSVRAQELCEGRDGRPGLPIPNSPYGLCGRKAILEHGHSVRTKELRESRGGHLGLNVPTSPYGPCGRKAILNLRNHNAASRPMSVIIIMMIVRLIIINY